MNIAALSIRRPIAVIILIAACLMFGAISIGRVGLDLLPDISLPMAAVITIYPNADPRTVEQTVAIPMERALRSLRGIKDVTSMSVENMAVALVEFNWGINLESSQQQIRTNLDAMEYSLPEGVQRPIISLIDLSQLPVLTLTVGVPGDVTDVTRIVRDVVKPAIDRVDGIAGASVSGAADQIISVEYDHQKLTNASLSPMILQQLIAMQNLSVPAGTIIDSGVRYQTRVGTGYQSADDIAGLTIGMKARDDASTSSGGLFGLSLLMPQFLTVGDVAEVKETAASSEGFARVNGKPAVMLMVQKQSGQNTVTAARRVKDALDKVVAANPEIEIAYVFDQSEVINTSLSGLWSNIIQGGILAIVVLWLFLRSLRSTMVIAVSIPLSIVFTFVMMYASKLNLNLLTLGGLALGVGMLVDASIVVLESIFRRQELGDSPVDAAVNGVKEVGMAIVATTLTTIVVFVPIVFLESLVGEIFRDLALTVIYSLTASLVVAFTVVPLMSVYMVRPNSSHGEGTQSPRRQARRLRFDIGLLYERMTVASAKHSNAVLLACLAAFIVSALVAPSLGIELFPSMDMGRVDIQTFLPPGTIVSRTNEMAVKVEQALMAIEGVEVVTAEVGSTGSGDYMSVLGGSSANVAKFSLGLIREGRDARNVEDVVSDTRAALSRVLADYEGAEFKTDASGWGSFGSSTSSIMSSAVTLEIRGDDSEKIMQHARDIAERFKQVPGFVEVMSDAQEAQPLMLLDINRTRALMGGLTVGQVGLGVRTSMLGTTVTYVERDGDLIPVIVKPKSDGPMTLDQLLDMPISASLGGTSSSITSAASQMGSNASAAARSIGTGSSLLTPPTEVLVGRVATPQMMDGPISLTRRNGVPYTLVKVGFEGMKLSQASDLAMKVASELPAPEGVVLALGGVNRVLADTWDDLAFVAIIAVVLVYMVMAIQYESLLYPFIVMFTLPLALIGAIGFLLLFGEPVSVMAIIGLIVLAGVVVDNGIVMVDFINQLKAAGMTTSEAVREGSRVRLRPILMTALTTILGLLPTAIGMGGKGSEMQRPLAITVMGGLTIATFLTLFVIPILYEFIDNALAKRRDRGYVR